MSRKDHYRLTDEDKADMAAFFAFLFFASVAIGYAWAARGNR